MMIRPQRLCLLIVLLPGCSRGPSQHPTADRATAALTAALDAWKAGQPAGEVQGGTPRVIAVDTVWQNGGKLGSYEIIGPVADSEPPRVKVKLSLQGAKAAAEEVSYVLVGADPLYVYRDIDYDRLLNMDNNPVAPRRAPGR